MFTCSMTDNTKKYKVGRSYKEAYYSYNSISPVIDVILFDARFLLMFDNYALILKAKFSNYILASNLILEYNHYLVVEIYEFSPKI